jgi:rhamnogalacturonyl hydrolase YesR
MRKYLFLAVAAALVVGFVSCKNARKEFVKENVVVAEEQSALLMQNLGEPTGSNYPRTYDDGKVHTTGMRDWVSGFFPGTLWYIYELTGNDTWRDAAAKWTHSLEPLKTHTGTHDLGFMMFCSYGNALRLAPQPEYQDILVETANSLISRFSDNTGLILSWNGFRAWDRERTFAFPVIIDNMMNLELLFFASKVTGNPVYYNVAVTHADNSIKHFFRPDGSTYHVVGFEPETGEVVGKATAQGWSDNSTWARGQAWAIYGYTMTYRETGDEAYLRTARAAVDWWLANVPEDMIPLWDFNAWQDGFVPDEFNNAPRFEVSRTQKDASAAAIVCSALFELGQLTGEARYTEAAEKTLRELASPRYRAEVGTNGGFLLKHSVGSLAHAREVDVPLSYADYYFMESLVRYKNLK